VKEQSIRTLTPATMKRYDSKIGPEIFIPLSLVFLLLFLLALMSKNWIGLLILTAVAIFIIHNIRNTFYIISNGILSIRCGWLYRSEIKIASITTIKEVIDIVGAPATSVFRLEISFNEIQSVAISPKKKAEFIHQLILLNPGIRLIPKSGSTLLNSPDIQ
jgi:hypothetical protein